MTSNEDLIPNLLVMAESAGQQGQFEAALQFLSQARQAAEEKRDPRLLADCSYYEGLLFQDMGELKRSLTTVQSALAAYRALNDTRKVAACLSNLVLVYQSLGDLDRAVSSGREALKVGRTLNDIEIEAAPCKIWGWFIMHKGKLAWPGKTLRRPVIYTRPMDYWKGWLMRLAISGISIFSKGSDPGAAIL